MARATWGSTDLGGTIGLLHAGATLRVATWPAPSQRPAAGGAGTIVMVPGRAEFIECYGETIADLRRLGFAVVAFDLRGQGGSSRKSRTGGHVETFKDYGADLAAVVRYAGQLGLPRPYTVLAHSMGGLAALLAQPLLAREVDRMVLLAPMLEVRDLPMPAGMLSMLSWGACLVGLARKPARKTAIASAGFGSNRVTSDPVRYARITALSEANDDLRIGQPTFGWMRAALGAMRRARRQRGKPLAIPTLFVASAADKVVSTAAIDRFARAAPGGGMVLVREARHQLLMERDELRTLFFAAFKAFLSDTPRRRNGGTRPPRQRRARFEIGSEGDPDRVYEGWKLPGEPAPAADRVPPAVAPGRAAPDAQADRAVPPPIAQPPRPVPPPVPAAPPQAVPMPPPVPAPAAAAPLAREEATGSVPAAADVAQPPEDTQQAPAAPQAPRPPEHAAEPSVGEQPGWLGAEEDDRDVLDLRERAFPPRDEPAAADETEPAAEPAPPILRATRAERLARRDEHPAPGPTGEDTAISRRARARLRRRLLRDGLDPDAGAPQADVGPAAAPPDPGAHESEGVGDIDWTVRDSDGDEFLAGDDGILVPGPAPMPPVRRDPLNSRRPRRR